MATWSLQDAKAKFSSVVRKAQSEGAQVVTKHGEDAVVVIDFTEYQKLLARGKKKAAKKGFKKSQNFAEIFLNSPLRGIGDDFFPPRVAEPMRDIDL